MSYFTMQTDNLRSVLTKKQSRIFFLPLWSIRPHKPYQNLRPRDSQLHVRMDQDTMDVLEKKAGDKGLTMSSYIRYLIHRADVEPTAHTGLISDNGTSQLLVGMIGELVTLFRGILAELGKTGNNLNQAVRDMNTSLKAGSKSVSRKDVLAVQACSTRMSECANGIWSGLRSLKQIVREL